MFAHVRYPPEMGDHHARRGVEIVFILVGQAAAADHFAQLFHGQCAVEQVGPVLALHHRPRIAIGFDRLHAADHRAHQVVDRDQAGDVAVFVDHQRQRLLLFAEDLQQLQRVGRFGHEQRRAHPGEQVGRHALGLAQPPQQRLGFEDAQDVPVAAAVHRETRERRFVHRRQIFFQRRGGVEPGDAHARRHQAYRGAVAEAEHAIHHLAFVGIDHALLVALGHQQADLLFTDRTARVVADAEQAQHQPVDRAEREHNRLGGGRQHLQRDRDHAGDGFGIGQREPFRDQFAEDHRTGGDHADRRADADRPGVFAHPRPDIVQPVGDLQADRIAAEYAGEHADQGDADLDGGQQVVGMLGQHQRGAGAAAGFVGVFGQLLEAQLARGQQGHLRQGEEGVEDDQGDDDQDFQHAVRSSVPERRARAGGCEITCCGAGGCGAGGGLVSSSIE